MGLGSAAVVLGIGPEGRVREPPECQDAEVGLKQEVADEVQGDELKEALLSADEGSRPIMVKTVRVKNSLRTLP